MDTVPQTAHRSAALVVVLLLAFVLTGSHGPSWSSNAAEPAAADPLVELNKAFRKAYAQTRKELLARTDPLIIVDGDELTLVRQGKRTTAHAIPEKYHSLKSICHVPLAIYVLILPNRDFWKFTVHAGDLILEESVYLAGAHGPRRAVQIVVYGHARSLPRVRWSFIHIDPNAPGSQAGAGEEVDLSI